MKEVTVPIAEAGQIGLDAGNSCAGLSGQQSVLEQGTRVARYRTSA